MHAASVHPEPGSNSRKICINTTHTGCTYLFPSLFCSYLLVRVSSSKEFRDSYFSHLHCFVLISVVQFSRIYAASLLRPDKPSGLPLRFRATFIYYHFSFRLSRAFQKFFQLFSPSPNSASIARYPLFFGTALLDYHIPSPLSTPFLKVF